MNTKINPVEFNVYTATRYAKHGLTDQWVQSYLNVKPWANSALAEGLRTRQWQWDGPVEISIDRLIRVLGPESNMLINVELHEWSKRVNAIADGINNPRDLPPLIVRADGDLLTITDGNHRHEALRRLGYRTCWCLIWRHS